MRAIHTECVCPPIPLRQFDWCATFVGDDEAGLQGWGATEDEAIADLRQQAEECEE